jgi:sulfur carrier protein ThiS adenylyltransferase
MLSQHEQVLYSRQVLLKQFGESGQQALLNASVAIVGIGGLGNPAALYLAAAGVGKLILVDGDRVDLTNLPRQILFSEQQLELNKAECAGEKLAAQYPNVDVEIVDEMLDEELGRYYFEQVDIILDCSDNMQTRHLINRLAIQLNKPLVIGAATGFDGQHLLVDPRNTDSACYHCLYPANAQAPANNCQTAGILGPVLAIIAGMQALTAIKLLTNNQLPINQLSLFDGLTNQWQQFKLSRQTSCPVCSDRVSSN